MLNGSGHVQLIFFVPGIDDTLRVSGVARLSKDPELMATMEEFGKPMWEIDESGYSIIDRVGLRRENWKDKESRDYYLSTWLDDIAAEVAFEEAMFMKYEYPQLVKEGVV